MIRFVCGCHKNSRELNQSADRELSFRRENVIHGNLMLSVYRRTQIDGCSLSSKKPFVVTRRRNEPR